MILSLHLMNINELANLTGPVVIVPFPWQSWSNSERLLNIIALIKCEDHHTKKLI